MCENLDVEFIYDIKFQVTMDSETWRLYAELSRIETDDHKPDLEKVLHCYGTCISTVLYGEMIQGAPAYSQSPKKCQK